MTNQHRAIRARDRDRELERLVETAKRVSASLDLETVLTAIVEDATSLLDATSGDMLLWERDRGVLRVVAVADFPPEMVGYEMRYGEGVSSQAIATGRTIQVDDYANDPRRAPHLERFDFGAVLCAPLLFRGAAIGTINVHAATTGGRFDAADADLLQAFAGLAAIAVDHARRFEELERRRLGDTIADLLVGGGDPDPTIAGRLAALGYRIERLRDVLVIGVRDIDGVRVDPSSGLLRRLDDLLMRDAPGSVVAAVDAAIVVLASVRRSRRLASPRALAERVQRTVHEQIGDVPVAVAIGDPPTSIADFGESYRLAREAVDVMAAIGRTEVIVETRELGVERLLLKSTNPDELRAFADRLLRPLLDYDARTGMDLVGTLSAFLAEDRNHRRAAARLFIHVNTMAYRLGRIEELSGRDPSDPGVIFELTLAMRVRNVLGNA